MRNTNKKGFTIVELVIVVAVIAILAAVLIPTFAGIIKQANISSDTQLCKNMNTALAMAKAEGKEFNEMEDVLRTINEAGYVVENLNPTTDGYYYAWDAKNDQIIFLNDKYQAHFPENPGNDTATTWVTVGTVAEAQALAAANYALYLETGFTGALALTNAVSVDAGANIGVELSIEDATATNAIVVRGDFANLIIETSGDVAQYGVADELDAKKVAMESLTINGYVAKLTVKEGHVKVANNGTVETFKAEAATAKVTNEGIIREISADSTAVASFDNKGVVVANNSTTISAADTTEKNSATFAVTISNRAELEAFRDSVNAGFTYAGMTVKLTADIDLAGIAWLPIGNVFRKNANLSGYISGFAGTFDGGNNTIKNLSNAGFRAAEMASGRYEDTAADGDEVVFGLFGCVMNATIKNLTVNANIDDTATGYVGDSNGAIVGYAYGDSFTMIDCKATGSVLGFDGVGGLVGRSYATTTTITGCVNDAKVSASSTSGGKAGGIIGYISSNGGRNGFGNNATTVNATITGCTNSGTITSGSHKGKIVVMDAIPLNGVKVSSANTGIDSVPAN